RGREEEYKKGGLNSQGVQLVTGVLFAACSHISLSVGLIQDAMWTRDRLWLCLFARLSRGWTKSVARFGWGQSELWPPSNEGAKFTSCVPHKSSEKKREKREAGEEFRDA
ncbi:unnamed protein product, partial [Ectocarpus sp. 12 AP-2014]